METSLSSEERQQLLLLAKQALEAAVKGQSLPALDLDSLPPRLRELGASFVTLTIQGELRGCIGALEAYLPLAEDVREHAMAAALHDYRFPAVSPQELPQIAVEISCLTPARLLAYQHPDELLDRLRPGIDGVVLKDGQHRATFLPQVWEKLPDPRDFLDHLCMKLGANPGYWRIKRMEVYTYQVEEFHEPGAA